MDKIPQGFENLAKALEAPEPPGWSVGSSEGGWASLEEIQKRWGSIAENLPEDTEPTPAIPRRRLAKHG